MRTRTLETSSPAIRLYRFDECAYVRRLVSSLRFHSFNSFPFHFHRCLFSLVNTLFSADPIYLAFSLIFWLFKYTNGNKMMCSSDMTCLFRASLRLLFDSDSFRNLTWNFRSEKILCSGNGKLDCFFLDYWRTNGTKLPCSMFQLI